MLRVTVYNEFYHEKIKDLLSDQVEEQRSKKRVTSREFMISDEDDI